LNDQFSGMIDSLFCRDVCGSVTCSHASRGTRIPLMRYQQRHWDHVHSMKSFMAVQPFSISHHIDASSDISVLSVSPDLISNAALMMLGMFLGLNDGPCI